MPFGRSGSLFFHSLFDGHPEISTIPGVYLKGWFDPHFWKDLAPNIEQPDWRGRLTEMFLEEYEPIFDANCRKNVKGEPFGSSSWLSRDTGFTEMGPHHSLPFQIDILAFSKTLGSLLQPLEKISSGEFSN